MRRRPPLGLVATSLALCVATYATGAAAQSATSPRSCSPGRATTIDPDGGRLIGVWRDPVSGVIRAAVAAPREIRVWQLSLAFASNHEFTATLPGRDTTPMRAWRTVAGDVLVSWRSGRADRLQLSRSGSLHMGRLALGAVADIPIARPAHTDHERMLGPLDDPSESRLAGIMIFVHAAGGGESPQLVLVDTALATPTLIPAGANGVLTAGVNLDDIGSHPADGPLLMAGENGLGAAIVRDQQDYEPLGPHGPFDMGRFSVERLSRSDGTGFPRIVMLASGGGLALWGPQPASAGGGISLDVQPVDARGHATGEPVVHALSLSPRRGIVPPALRDVAIVGDEVWVSVQTGADDASSTPQSTLVRLDSRGAQVAPPVTVPIASPHITPAGADAAILWSERDASAVVVRCTAALVRR